LSSVFCLLFWRRFIKELKINQDIAYDPVYLIDDTGCAQGAVSLDQAMYLAYEKGLDLALINGNAKPAVCKLMDYGKFLYSQNKQLAKQKARTHETEIKEVRLSIKIDPHDLEVKTNRIRQFLVRGDKVKISIKLKGREMMFASRVKDLIEKVRSESGGILEKPTERMGANFFTVITRGKNETQNS